MNITRVISTIIVFTLISLNSALGQSNKTSPFIIDFGTEAILLGSGAVTGIAALAILLNLDPLTQEQLNELNPNNVNSFDRAAIGPFSEDYLGDVLQYSIYLLPFTFLANKESRSDFGDLALMYGEVLLLNASITGIVKGLSGRIRPYVYDEHSSLGKKTNVDARLSFYSGHTSNTASVCFFTASVFNEYLFNNTVKIVIWSTAALIPAVTGFSRVNTHWHFPTDVIVGYIIGAAIGYLIPLIHKRNADDSHQVFMTENIYKPLIGFQFKL